MIYLLFISGRRNSIDFRPEQNTQVNVSRLDGLAALPEDSGRPECARPDLIECQRWPLAGLEGSGGEF